MMAVGPAQGAMPEALHPLTGDMRRPGSGGFGEGSLAPLEGEAPAGPPLQGPVLTVQSMIDGLDAEVAEVAARREQEKTWKATFKQDKQAMAARLADMGMKDSGANYARREAERQLREKHRFEQEKAAMKRRLALMSAPDRGDQAAPGAAAAAAAEAAA
eukprot:COSAG04_NODE_6857_length_1240_cov_1.474145_1_plen_158_part_10